MIGRKFIGVGVGKAVPAIGAILFNLYIASRLSPGEADIFFIWFAVIYLLGILGRLGFDIYVLRDISNRKLLSATEAKRSVFIVSLAITLLALVWAPKNVWGLLFSLPALSIASVNAAVMRAQGKEALSGIFEISLSAFLAFIFLIVQELMGVQLTVELASVCFAAGSITQLLFSEILVGGQHWILRAGKLFSPNVKEALKFVPSPLMMYVIQWMAVFFLSNINAGSASIYSVAVRLASGFAFVAITIDAFVAPRFSKYYELGDWQGIKELMRVVRMRSLLFFGFCLGIYVIAGSYWVDYFLGMEYDGVFEVSIIISMSYLIMLQIGPYQYLLLMSGGESRVNISNGLSLFLCFLGMLVLWQFSIQNVLAYAGVVALSRVIGIVMMWHFSSEIMRGRKCVK